MHIKQYTPAHFTATFMPSPELSAQLRGDTSQFFILPLEAMYQHVHAAVPPCKGTSHSYLPLTEGNASMQISGGHYTIHPGDILIVPAGLVFSFPHGGINKGWLYPQLPQYLGAGKVIAAGRDQRVLKACMHWAQMKPYRSTRMTIP